MKLYEFEGNDLLCREGIPVPDYVLATTAEEAREKAETLELPVVVHNRRADKDLRNPSCGNHLCRVGHRFPRPHPTVFPPASRLRWKVY